MALHTCHVVRRGEDRPQPGDLLPASQYSQVASALLPAFLTMHSTEKYREHQSGRPGLRLSLISFRLWRRNWHEFSGRPRLFRVLPQAEIVCRLHLLLEVNSAKRFLRVVLTRYGKHKAYTICSDVCSFIRPRLISMWTVPVVG